MRYLTWYRPGQHDYGYAERAMKAGLAGFEVVHRQSYLTPEVQEQYLEDLRRIKVELGAMVAVHAPAGDVNLGSLNSRVRQASFEEIRESMEFASRIGASVVVIHPTPGILGMPEGRWSREEQVPRHEGEKLARQEEYLIRAVKDLADLAPDLLLCLENLVYPHEIYRSPEDMAELVKKINRTNVGVTLDVGHAAVCGHKPEDFLHRLQDEIFHVHLHDNDGVIDQHLPLGRGVIDYVAVIHSLKEMDYQGVVNLEFKLEDPAGYSEYIRQF